jgi:cytoskeleton protein RodZ
MSDGDGQAQVARSGPGARLETARRKQGLHIAALAAQLKVSPKRLEALEAERWEDLPDATHARALATSVCRVLGIDPAPVLAGMPRVQGAALERVSAGLNQPVRDGGPIHLPRSLGWLAAALLLLVALALALWPRDGERGLIGRAALEETATAPALLPSAAAPLVSEAVASAVLPASAVASAAAAQAASATAPAASAAPQLPGAAALLEIRAESGASWISVTDAQGVSHAARLLQAGEVFALPQAATPLRVTLGNAPALRLSWRGEAQPLTAYETTRVARLELK